MIWMLCAYRISVISSCLPKSSEKNWIKSSESLIVWILKIEFEQKIMVYIMVLMNELINVLMK